MSAARHLPAVPCSRMEIEDVPVVGSEGRPSPSGSRRRWGPVLGGAVFVVAAVLVIGSLDSPDEEPVPTDPTFLVEPTDPIGASLDRLLAGGPWVTHALPGSGFAAALAHREGQWLTAVPSWSGGTQIWISPDAATWSPVFDQDLVEARALTLGSLDDGTWLAGGSVTRPASDISSVPIPTAMLWTSRDGKDWRPVEGLPFGEDPGQEVTDLEIVGSRVVLFLGPPTFFVAPPTDGAGAVWESLDDGRSWNPLPIEGRALVLTTIGDEIVIGGQLDLAPVLWRSSNDYAPEAVPSLDIGSVGALAELPSGGALGRIENALNDLWVISRDLSTWMELPDPPLTVRDSRLERAGPVMLAFPGDQSPNPAVQATEDGLEWVPITAGSSVERPSTATWVRGELVLAGASGSGPSLWRTAGSGPVRLDIDDMVGGTWETVFEKPAAWRRTAASGGRLVVGDQGAVYEWSDGRFDLLGSETPDGFDGVADQLLATHSATFLIDGFDLFMYREAEGWTSGKTPIGFLVQAIIETDSGFVAAAIVGERVEVSRSRDGLTWDEPQPAGVDSTFVLATADGRLVAGPGGTFGYRWSGDGIDWVEASEAVLPSSLDAWAIEQVSGSLGILGPAGETVSFELPPGFLPRYASRVTGGRLVVIGWNEGRPVLAVVGKNPPLILPAGLSNGLSRDIFDAFVTDDGFVVALDAEQRVLVWRPQ